MTIMTRVWKRALAALASASSLSAASLPYVALQAGGGGRRKAHAWMDGWIRVHCVGRGHELYSITFGCMPAYHAFFTAHSIVWQW